MRNAIQLGKDLGNREITVITENSASIAYGLTLISINFSSSVSDLFMKSFRQININIAVLSKLIVFRVGFSYVFHSQHCSLLLHFSLLRLLSNSNGNLL